MGATRLNWNRGRGRFSLGVVAMVSMGCCSQLVGQEVPGREADPPDGGAIYAIAVHGGAGGLVEDPAARERRIEGLRDALALGRDRLAEGASALDVVEAVVRLLEDDPVFNAGRGAVLNEDGQAECDASIMDGRTLACGGSAITRRVRHPVTLARAVMEDDRHVLLAGAGADRFAEANGLEVADPSWFVTEDEAAKLEEARARAEAKAAPEQNPEEQEASHDAAVDAADAADPKGETVGCVALDRYGHLAAATSTGGRRNKRAGRIGDSPIVGAGTYADDRTCAVSGTGVGEEFIRRAAAYDVSARMAYRGDPLDGAVRAVVFDSLEPGHGGMIAVGHDGSISIHFNTPAMSRGFADSGGRFEVAVGGAEEEAAEAPGR